MRITARAMTASIRNWVSKQRRLSFSVDMQTGCGIVMVMVVVMVDRKGDDPLYSY